DMPALPRELFNRFVTEYQLPAYDAQVLTDSADVAWYYQEICGVIPHYKSASNWVMGPVKSYLNEHNTTARDFPLSPQKLGAIIALVEEGKVSFTVASQRLFQEMIRNPDADPLALAEQLNLLQESDEGSILPVV